MTTNLLKRLDALLDDSLVTGKEPLGAHDCDQDDVEDVDEVWWCGVCLADVHCQYKCMTCGQKFCSEMHLDRHYAKDY